MGIENGDLGPRGPEPWGSVGKCNVSPLGENEEHQESLQWWWRHLTRRDGQSL